MTEETIFYKKYSDEGLIDLEEDLFQILNSIRFTNTEDGLVPGTFTVVVTYNEDD